MRALQLMFRIPGFISRRIITGAVALILIPFLPAAAFAQVPSDLFGQWSSDQSRCWNNQDENVTIFGIGPREISWYEITCDVRNVRPAGDGVFLQVDCEKGGGIRGSGEINIRRVSPHSIDVHVSPLGFSTELRYSLRRCQTANEQHEPSSKPPSYWNHNGSTMYLVANGSSREFYYERPRPGMIEAGARPGSLLFSGEALGDSYEGTAYVFNPRCGPTGYRVSGPILDGYRRVVLRGQAPRVNHRCQITGYRADRLEFELTGR